MKHSKIYWFALLLAAVYCCKVPYQPPLSNATTGYLVVDGVINNANGNTDSTFIKLSRTSKLSASAAIIGELHAQVSVEDGQGFTAALKETTNGNYVAGPLGLDNTKQYRLRIKTTNGETYLSALAAPVYTPPIDSIGYTVNGDQVAIYANTHNPANNTRYYHWDYTETWEILPAYSPYRGSYPSPCWVNGASIDIALASTTKLVSDVVYQAPITYITGVASQRLSVRYSMLLKQYGLTPDAYTFWSQLQKNTEQLGSIFDAQPSQINGNIHSTTNPAEPVFGYISVINIQTKRIYISRTSLPPNFQTEPYSCPLDSVFTKNPKQPGGTQLIPLYPFSSPSGSGFISTVLGCVDCAVEGSAIKPSFWTGP